MILYSVRFALGGDLRNSPKSPGGMASQIPHISIALHLGVTKILRATDYDCEIRNRTHRLAPRRDRSGEFYKIICASEEGVN